MKKSSYFRLLRSLGLLIINITWFNFSALAQYIASPPSTNSGGGDFGSVLRMAATVSGTTGTFTITKINGGPFSSNGTLTLRVGTFTGEVHQQQSVTSGTFTYTLTDEFSDYPTYPKSYYARFESAAGVSWVGPIFISCAPPPAPVLNSISKFGPGGPIGFNLGWSSVSGVSRYRLYRNGLQIYCGTGTNHTDSGTHLSDNIDYSYYVLADSGNYCGQGTANGCGTSANSNTQTVRWHTPPPPPGVSASPNSNTSVVINWNPSTGATRYKVRLNVGSTMIDERSAASGAPYSWEGLATRQQHCFTVIACNDGCSVDSSALPGVCATPMSQGSVSNVNVSASTIAIGAQFNVTWNCNASASDLMTISLKRLSYGGSVQNADYVVLTGNNSNTGSASFTVPSGINPASDWRVYVKHNNTGLLNQSAAITINPGGAPTGYRFYQVDATNNSINQWLNTGLNVIAGQPLGITASGTACLAGQYCVGPNGDSGGGTSNGFLNGALIGKIGAGGASFLIGANFQQNASATGLLYLAVNDSFYPDNSSGFKVNIGNCVVPAVKFGNPTLNGPADGAVNFGTVNGNSVSVTFNWALNAPTSDADSWLLVRDMTTDRLVFNQNLGSQQSYMLSNLVPNRQYRWSVLAMPKTTLNCISDGASATFTTASGPTGLTIAGTVFNSDNVNGLSGVTVCISGQGVNNCLAITSADGTYTLGTVTALQPGQYIVTPQKSGVTFYPASRAIAIAAQNATGVNFWTDSGVPQVNIVIPGHGAAVSGDIQFTGAALMSSTLLSLDRLVLTVNGVDVGKVEGANFGAGFFGYQALLKEVTWTTMVGVPLTNWTQVLPTSGYATLQIRAEGSNGKNGYSPKVALRHGTALTVAITSPTSAEMPFLQGSAITATSSVSGCVSSCTYEWSVNGDCQNCMGPTLNFTAQSTASSKLTLAVTDTLGNYASANLPLAIDMLSLNGDPDALLQAIAGFGVNVVNGNFFMQRSDLSLPAVGVPLSLTRAYNSNTKTGLAANAVPEPFGKGWTHSYNLKLIGSFGSSKVDVVWGDGLVESWFLVNGNYRSAINNFSILKQNGSNIEVITKTQMKYVFNSSGRLIEIRDSRNNYVELLYDGNGRLQTVTNRSAINGNGRSIVLAYDGAGRIQTATDNMGRQVIYGYDANGYLSAVTDLRGKTERYEYVTKGNNWLLQVVRDKKNNIALTNSYNDTTNYRCFRQTDNAGRSFEFEYFTSQTIVRNPLGQPTTFIFDGAKRITDIIDPQSYKSTTSYLDSNIPSNRGLANASINPVQNNSSNPVLRTEMQYSSGNTRGNLTKMTEPVVGVSGNRLEHNFDYLTDEQSNRNLLTRYTDPAGNPTAISYDASLDLPVTITYPAGSGMSPVNYAYNSRGQTLSVTTTRDGNPQVTQNEYNNSYFDLTRVITPMGFSTSYEYDAAGRVLKITDPLGKTVEFTYEGDLVKTEKVQIDAGRFATTTYNYDDNGQVLSIQRPLGLTTNEYSTLGLLTKTSAPTGEITNYEYDALNRLIRTTFTSDSVNPIESAYDASGRVVSQRNVNLAETMSYVYDGNGNVLSESVSLGGNQTRRKIYEYDASDRVIKISYNDETNEQFTYTDQSKVATARDRRGNVTTYAYDSLGRLKETVEPISSSPTVVTAITRVSYDSVGNLKEITDPNDKKIRFEYDNDNRLTKRIEDATGAAFQFQYAYDAKNRLATYTAPDGLTATYTYFDSDWLKSIVYSNGAPGNNTTITFSYNDNGHLTGMADGAGNTSYSRDALGRMLSRTDPFRNSVGYSYDNLGRLATITYPGNKQVAYGYDAANRMKTVTSWLGVMATYSYNQAGQLSSVINGNGTTTSYEYQPTNGRLTGIYNRKSDGTVIASYQFTLDGNGNRTKIDTVQPLDPAPPTPQTVNYSYNGANHLLTAGNKTFTFNSRGVLTQITAPGGNSIFSFDVLDRLTNLTAPGTTASFAYDGMNNRLSQTVSGTTTRYVLDTNKELTDVLMETNTSNAPQRYYIYGLGLIAQTDGSGTNPHYYHYNGIGSTVALTESSQNVTDAYVYDSFGSLLSQLGSTPNPFQFVGQFGVQQSAAGLQFMRARYYSPETGQFISRDRKWGRSDLSQSLNLYAYAGSNPLLFSDPSGLSSISSLLNGQFDKFKRSLEKNFVAGPSFIATTITKDAAEMLAFYAKAKFLQQFADKLVVGLENAQQGSALRFVDLTIEEFGGFLPVEYRLATAERATRYADLVWDVYTISKNVLGLASVPKGIISSLSRSQELVKSVDSVTKAFIFTFSFAGLTTYNAFDTVSTIATLKDAAKGVTERNGAIELNDINQILVGIYPGADKIIRNFYDAYIARNGRNAEGNISYGIYKRMHGPTALKKHLQGKKPGQ